MNQDLSILHLVLQASVVVQLVMATLLGVSLASEFVVRAQQEAPHTVRRMALQCQVSDRQFLAAPHFPGLYAFLSIQAPAWESYYLHNRPQPMQEQHLRAMEEVRLAIVATESTIDQLDRLLLGQAQRGGRPAGRCHHADHQRRFARGLCPGRGVGCRQQQGRRQQPFDGLHVSAPRCGCRDGTQRARSSRYRPIQAR